MKIIVKDLLASSEVSAEKIFIAQKEPVSDETLRLKDVRFALSPRGPLLVEAAFPPGNEGRRKRGPVKSRPGLFPTLAASSLVNVAFSFLAGVIDVDGFQFGEEFHPFGPHLSGSHAGGFDTAER